MNSPRARIFLVFLATRALLVLATFVAWPLDRCLEPPLDQRAPWSAGGSYLPGDPPPWLDAFGHMDAEYYLAIAAFGYAASPDGRPPQHAGFFPGYPMAVRGVAGALNAIRGHPGASLLEAPVAGLVSAWLVSNVALLFAAWALFRLGRLFLDERLAESAATWLLVCPVAFFGSAFLAEALFLWLSIASLLWAFRRRMGWAVMFGAAAAFTRPAGALLVVPLLLISLRARAEGRRVLRDCLLMLAVPAGLLAVFAWHARTLGDPWAYFTIQSSYGHGGFPDFAGVADLFRVGDKSALSLVRDAVQIAGLAVAAVCTAPLVSSRGRALPGALAAWALVSIAFVLLSGHLISLPRYLFAVFPLFIGAAMVFPQGRWSRGFQIASTAIQVAGFVAFMRAWPVLI